MNSFWTQILIQTILNDKNKNSGQKKKYSNYRLAKAYREFLIHCKRHVKDTMLISAGIFSAAFGFKGFLLTNHFIDGGAT
jgi:hypothetical protein